MELYEVVNKFDDMVSEGINVDGHEVHSAIEWYERDSEGCVESWEQFLTDMGQTCDIAAETLFG